VRDARAWLAQRDRATPFFLWVHVFDPHAPYAPPPEALAKASHPYYGEVAAMDAALGELFADLRREGTLEHALVIVVADHGESLGEHGEDTHGCSCSTRPCACRSSCAIRRQSARARRVASS
jgi:arylsulfatase A-like enzyme